MNQEISDEPVKGINLGVAYNKQTFTPKRY